MTYVPLTAQAWQETRDALSLAIRNTLRGTDVIALDVGSCFVITRRWQHPNGGVLYAWRTASDPRAPTSDEPWMTLGADIMDASQEVANVAIAIIIRRDDPE